MTTAPRNEDLEHLRLLSIFHYVVGGIALLMACFPIIHLVMGIAVVTGRMGAGPNAPPRFVGTIFIAMAAVIMTLGVALAILLFLAAGYLREQVHFTFCLVTAAIACIFTPFGTVLGVLTIIVLMRPSVKARFGQVPAAP